jgi:hypothetical protein
MVFFCVDGYEPSRSITQNFSRNGSYAISCLISYAVNAMQNHACFNSIILNMWNTIFESLAFSSVLIISSHK